MVRSFPTDDNYLVRRMHHVKDRANEMHLT